jgi:hypothetical protein
MDVSAIACLGGVDIGVGVNLLHEGFVGEVALIVRSFESLPRQHKHQDIWP